MKSKFIRGPSYRRALQQKIFFTFFMGTEAGSAVGTSFAVYVRNSVIIAGTVTTTFLFFSILGAYSLARLRYRGKYFWSSYMLFTYLFPPVVLMIPMYLIMASLGLLNTLQAIIICHLTRTVPFSVWLLNGYFKTLPPDIEESAYLDGCGRLQALLRVVLPVALPGLVVAAIYSFTASWNDFIFAYILVDKPPLLPLSVAAMRIIKFEYVRWSSLMAAGIVSAAVPAALYMFIQKYVVQGLTAGAVKG